MSRLLASVPIIIMWACVPCQALVIGWTQLDRATIYVVGSGRPVLHEPPSFHRSYPGEDTKLDGLTAPEDAEPRNHQSSPTSGNQGSSISNSGLSIGAVSGINILKFAIVILGLIIAAALWVGVATIIITAPFTIIAWLFAAIAAAFAKHKQSARDKEAMVIKSRFERRK